jgi:hypothetical protein
MKELLNNAPTDLKNMARNSYKGTILLAEHIAQRNNLLSREVLAYLTGII